MIPREIAVRLVPLLTIGICDQLTAKTLSILEAEQLLFSPHAMQFFGEIDDKLAELIHDGTELDDINDLVPDSLPKAIDELRSKAEDYLAQAVVNEGTMRDHWFEVQ
jgi:hypothetical protein